MADRPGAQGGQNLGWWTEKELTTPSLESHKPWWRQSDPINPTTGGVASPSESATAETEAEPVLPDIGQELEEEAMRRLASNAPIALVEIYANTERINARALKSMVIMSGLVAAYATADAIMFHDPWKLMLLPIFVVEVAAIIKLMSHFVGKQKRPVVTLSRDGLEVHFLFQNIGLVPWDEIEQIGAFNNCGERYVGVVPKNSDALCRRLPAFGAFCVRANSRFCRLFPKKMRRSMAPITLSARGLPMSVDELVAQIDTFRRENSV